MAIISVVVKCTYNSDATKPFMTHFRIEGSKWEAFGSANPFDASNGDWSFSAAGGGVRGTTLDANSKPDGFFNNFKPSEASVGDRGDGYSSKKPVTFKWEVDMVTTDD